jgi:polyhydroxyalkanoate synthesis repressor PhaR
MPLIKRYANRKLYDTEAKRYITLHGIAKLIQEGEEVQVVDNVSGEDLTAVTLTQIIFEKEKQRSGFLPKAVLTSLVQAGGDTLGGLRRGLASPLGLLRQVDEEIEKRLQHLISRGELAKEEGLRLRDKLLAESPRLGENELAKLLHKRGIPTKDELQVLSDKLDDLASKIDAFNQDSEGDST